ncbi:tigger transposable element-derived protein 6-like [Ornithodoros turicata]|uniref:tigger transposable element-derived protein 6-like n=1 Tax=Ornithodoros turicata TaxID=34597 RepID=UPI0031398406
MQHMIVGKTASGECHAADTEQASAWRKDRLPEIMETYKPSDIYNADETGLFFQMLPKNTLALKGDCHGGKQSMLRLTVLLCTNMDGSDKCVPLVIGKSARPRSSKNAARIPIKYVANTKARMTRSIFVEWPNELNNDMKSQRRNVCLLVDNCSAHHIQGLELSNVQVHFFPANCTSLIQPLDQGIINGEKFAYRRCLIDRLLLNLRLNLSTKVEASHAVEMLSAVWKSTGAVIIANCFRKAGLGLCEQETAAETGTVQPGLVQAW